MHEVLVNGLGGLSLHGKSVVRLTDRHDMTLDVYCVRKTTTQQQPGIKTNRGPVTHGLLILALLMTENASFFGSLCLQTKQYSVFVLENNLVIFV